MYVYVHVGVFGWKEKEMEKELQKLWVLPSIVSSRKV